VKGYEYRKGEYIMVDEDELKKIAPATATMMEILQFVKAGEVDPIYFETSYYVAPDEVRSKPYALLRDALEATEYCAIAKVATPLRKHVAILRPAKSGIVMHTMFYQDELHQERSPGESGQGKRKGEKIAPVARLKKAKVVDILEALKKSLKELTKTGRAEAAPAANKKAAKEKDQTHSGLITPCPASRYNGQ